MQEPLRDLRKPFTLDIGTIRLKETNLGAAELIEGGIVGWGQFP
jgi:hypothetical protein